MKKTSLNPTEKLKDIPIVKQDITQKLNHPTSKHENSPKKPIRLDPIRYGDWEKNGRCIDF